LKKPERRTYCDIIMNLRVSNVIDNAINWLPVGSKEGILEM